MRGVEKLLAERLSQRAIVRATGVSRMTVAKILKKACFLPPAIPPVTEVEIDEMTTFIRHKNYQIWLWIALCRHSRKVLAYYRSGGPSG